MDSTDQLPLHHQWRSVVRATRAVLVQTVAICALLTVGWYVLAAVGAQPEPLLPQLLWCSAAATLSSELVIAVIDGARPAGRPMLRMVLVGSLTAGAIAATGLPSLYPVMVAGAALITLTRHPGLRTELTAGAVTLAGTGALLIGVHLGLIDTLLPGPATDLVGGALLIAGLAFLRYVGALSTELSTRGNALVAEQARRVSELHHASTHDPLTGLLNRAGLAQAVEAALASAAPGRGTGVVYLDLDGFKPINDTFGHAAGDILLGVVAERLRAAVRSRDEVARVGGDEFVVLVHGLVDAAALDAVVARIQLLISEPVELPGTSTRVGASAGTACTEDPATTMSELLARANHAMYAVKAIRPHRAVAPSTEGARL